MTTTSRLLLALPFLLAMQQAAGAATLTGAWAEAIGRDPNVAAIDKAVRQADSQIAGARSRLFPVVSLSGQLASDRYERSTGPMALFTRAADLRATQLIWDGAGAWHRLSGAEADRLAAASERTRVTADAVLEVSRAYISVVRERGLLVAAERYQAQHEQAVARFEKMASADDGKRFELEQVRTRAIYAASLVTERRASMRAAERIFKELVGTMPGELSAPAVLGGKGFGSLDEALALAEDQNPALVTARQRVKSANAGRLQAEAVLQPTFSLASQYRMGYDRDGLPGRNDVGYVGVLASFSLSTGGAPMAGVRASKANEETAAGRLDATRRKVRENVSVAWARRQGAIEKLPQVEQQLTWAVKVVDGFQTQFKAGRRTALEILTIQGQAFQAENDAINVRADRRLADFELAYHEGQLPRWFTFSVPTTRRETR